jgi:hypothetical protein
MWVEPPEVIATGDAITSVWGSSATDVYASGAAQWIYHSAGAGTWLRQTTPATTLHQVRGAGPADVYAISGTEVFYSRGDGNWAKQSLPPQDVAAETFSSVFAVSPNAIYVGTTMGRLWRSNGNGEWAAQYVDSSRTGIFVIAAIWGAAPDSIYLATDFGVYRGTVP